MMPRVNQNNDYGAQASNHHAATSESPGTLLGVNNDDEDAKIVDMLDKLSDLGLSRYYELPQIIVCGDQSAGKSSVMEAITEIPFPRDEKTCTRYVTKVTLRRSPVESAEVKIQPDPHRPQQERDILSAFRRYEDGPASKDNLSAFMRDASEVIFSGSASRKLIVDDVLLICLAAPGKRPLQLLDLPGLIGYDQTNKGNEAKVETMVKSYMAMSQSMILAVVKATDDINNPKVLTYCRDYDKKGQRTLGVITRPDIAEEIQAKNWIDVMLRRDAAFRFKHDWHVLRNRNIAELRANTATAQRDEEEMRFLSREPWNEAPLRDRGIVALRERLRHMLFTVARRELPKLQEIILLRRERIGQEYYSLGGETLKTEEIITVFRRATQRLRDSALAHARGIYGADTRMFPDDSAVHLRARVRDQDEHFRDMIHRYGHSWETFISSERFGPLGALDSSPTDSAVLSNPQVGHVKYGNLEDEVAAVARMLKQKHGTELPGDFNPDRISELFWKMSERWDGIAQAYVDKIHDCCKAYFRAMTPVAFERRHKVARGSAPHGFANSETVSRRYVETHIVPKLRRCKEEAEIELSKFEDDRLCAAKNLDMGFVQERQHYLQSKRLSSAMKAYHEANSPPNKAKFLDPGTYAKYAGLPSDRDFMGEAAEGYLAAMWFHYCIAREHFVANVSTMVIERHFLRRIENLITDDLDLDDIKKLVREEDGLERRKEDLRKELEVLDNCLCVLRDY